MWGAFEASTLAGVLVLLSLTNDIGLEVTGREETFDGEYLFILGALCNRLI